MKREAQLRHRLQSLGALHEAVQAMKSLSALHFRVSRAILPTARDYRDGVEAALAAIQLPPLPPSQGPRGLLVVAADLGLCGDYNSRLAQAATHWRENLGAGPLFCIGRRVRSALSRLSYSIDRTYSSPTSTTGLTDLLLEVAYDIFEDFRMGRIAGLSVVSARFEGAGHFSPVCTPVLPIVSPRPSQPVRPSRYVTGNHLALVVQREMLYITLYELLLEALASEHGTRLVAAQSAEQWLDGRQRDTRTALMSLRRETATQEVLDIATGARSQRAKSQARRRASSRRFR